MRYCLAYGSNLSVEQMLHRCPDAVYIGTGQVQDYHLVFRGSKAGSYLTIEKKKGSIVPVLVWRISTKDEDSLDIYEGFPRFYRKEEMEIEVRSLADGSMLGIKKAFAYVMDERRPRGVPTRSYCDICQEGYERFGFDLQILETALLEALQARIRQ